MWLRLHPASRLRLGLACALLLLTLLMAAPRLARSQEFGNQYFERTWTRTDYPVKLLQVGRTWMWGPQPNTPVLQEPYAESPGGLRDVQYFDKSRMEITHPDTGDPDSIWYVTNGLLSLELISGRLQLGDNIFEQHQPAEINVAGDENDEAGPTYRTFSNRLDDPPAAVGSLVTRRIDRSGTVTDDASLASRGVTIATVDDVTAHAIPQPFWDFMRSSGLIWNGDAFVIGVLFESEYFATGRPVAEAYWATVLVGGAPKDVLMQCFERRCLTYTPDNDPGWRVEAGNVGQHYYRWLYELIPLESTGPQQPVEEAPAAPSNVTATGIDGDTVRLTWTDNSDNEERFEISTDAVQVIRAVPANTTAVDVTASGYACYKVRAVNVAGASSWSDGWACASPLAPPSAPTGATAAGRVAADGSPEIAVGWQDNSDNESQFVIYRWPEGAESRAAAIASVAANTTAYVDGSIQFGEAWCYAVAASGPGGESDRSNSACAMVPAPAQAPAAPSAVSAASNYDSSINAPRLTVTWIDNAADELGFNVYRFAPGDEVGDFPVAVLGADVTEYHDWNVLAGETWCYAVSAFDGEAESPKVASSAACALAVDPGPLP